MKGRGTSHSELPALSSQQSDILFAKRRPKDEEHPAMKQKLLLTAAVFAAAVLAGCQSNPERAGASGVPNAAEQACLRDVTQKTNNPDVVLLGSEPYQGGARYVRVGVGPDRAVWQCIGHSSGSTSEIMYLGQ